MAFINMEMTTDKYRSFLTGIDQLQALGKSDPGHVPVFAGMHDFVRHELKLGSRAFYFKPEVFVPAMLDTQLKYGIDMATVSYDSYNIEAGALGQEVSFDEDSVPSVGNPIIGSKDDLKKIKTPDFESDGRFPFVNGVNEEFQRLTGLPPIIKFCAPFSLAANLRGIENLIMDMCINPGFARDLLTALTEEVVAPWIAYQQRRFPDASITWGADAYASPPILSPAFLAEWALPTVLRLQELCGKSVAVPNWVGDCCVDDPEEMFDYKLQVCPGFLEGQDPDVEEVGAEKYKAYADRNDLSLILGVGARFLALATEKEVAERVRRYVEVGGGNGRFILYLCGLVKTTPPENVRAAIAAIRPE